MQTIKPPRLLPGDVIGVVAPSNEAASIRAEVELGMRRLEWYGFRVRQGAHLWSQNPTRAEKLADLHAMWADPEVKAIFCATGGTTAITLVDGLDYALIARNPKVFIGMSDISLLLTAILAWTGLVTCHSSCLAQGLGSPDAEVEGPHLLRVIAGTEPAGPLPDWAGGVRLVRRGTGGAQAVQGRLIAGNLGCMTHLLGTPYWPDTTGAIVGLEAVNMKSSAILRWLGQLRLSGALDRAACLLFGHMEGCFSEWSSPEEGLAWAVANGLGDLELPVYQSESFGHFVPNATLPVGAVAAITGGRLVIKESAVG